MRPAEPVIPRIFPRILSCIMALLLPAAAYSAPAELVALLDNIIENQPEQQITQGLQEMHSTNQQYSDSWIAGDVDLVVHHENDTLTDNDDYKNWQVGVEFPLWLSSQKQAQKTITRSYGEQLSAYQLYLRWLASEQLRKLVWNYRTAEIEVDAARSALQKSQSLLNKVILKVKAGESPRIDQLLAHKAVLKQQNNLVQKRSALTIAQNQFRRWTRTHNLPQNILEQPLSPLPLDQHPKIIQLSSALQISRAMMKKTQAGKRDNPKVFLGAQNDKDKSSENNSLILEVSIPLGVNPGFSPRLAEKKRNVYEQQAVLDKARIQLEQAIFQAQQQLTSAQQSIHLAKEQYAISIKALSMSEQAYQLGETNIQNLLLVQQQTAEAKRDFRLAEARSGQAIANLNQVSGHILGAQQ